MPARLITNTYAHFAYVRPGGISGRLPYGSGPLSRGAAMGLRGLSGRGHDQCADDEYRPHGAEDAGEGREAHL